jgi:hypothetical protein
VAGALTAAALTSMEGSRKKACASVSEMRDLCCNRSDASSATNLSLTNRPFLLRHLMRKDCVGAREQVDRILQEGTEVRDQQLGGFEQREQ